MRKIIKNKVYDTETATYISSYCYKPEDRLYGYDEELYRKRTGEYFLCCDGGPGSRYSREYGSNSREGIALIEPLTYDEAKEWAEENLPAETYEAEFGKVVEDESVVRLYAYIPAALNDKIEVARSKQGVAKNDVIIAALEKYFKKND